MTHREEPRLDPGPSSAADALSGAPVYERVVVFSKALRGILVAFGVVTALLLPMLILLFDAYRFDIVCTEAERQCVIVEHRAFETIRTVAPFDEIKVVQAHVEWHQASRGRDRSPTGRVLLTFNMNDGREILASLNAAPQALHADELRAFIKAPTSDRIAVTTRLAALDLVFILLMFVGGLALLAVSQWRSEVSIDPATSTIVIARRYWPLLKRTQVRASADDIAQVVLKRGEFVHTVEVQQRSGPCTRIARTAFLGPAEQLVAAIRQMQRRAAQR